MKRVITLFALSFVFCLGTIVTHAQGKGSSRGPAAGTGPKQKGHGSSSRPGSHSTKGTKGAQREAKFENKIEQNPQLKARLTRLLPTGMTLKTAASGFKNQGQFIAALNASKNLKIPFGELKARMTGSHPRSLGQAIHAFKPNLSENVVKREAQKAINQAKAMEKGPRIT